jgi:hypothetical protein
VVTQTYKPKQKVKEGNREHFKITHVRTAHTRTEKKKKTGRYLYYLRCAFPSRFVLVKKHDGIGVLRTPFLMSETNRKEGRVKRRVK